MLFYRFDVPNQKFYYRTEDSKEISVKFSDMYEMVCMLAKDPSLFEELRQHSEKGYRARKNLSTFRAYISDFPVQIKSKKAWGFMTNAMYDFSAFHNHYFCRSIRLWFVDRYYRRNLEPQYQQMTHALRICTAAANHDQKEKYPLYCTVLDNKVYHSTEPDQLLCCSFLMEFMEAIHAAGLSVKKCKVCGTLFCSTSEDDCCSDRLCRKLLREASDDNRAALITKIRSKLTDKIGHDREYLRNKGCPPEAEELFDAKIKPLRKSVIRRVKELRRYDASLLEIHTLEKELEAVYKKINNIKAEIVARYST